MCTRACVCVCVSRVCSSRGCRARRDDADLVVVAHTTGNAAGAAGEGERMGNAWREAMARAAARRRARMARARGGEVGVWWWRLCIAKSARRSFW